MNNDENNKQQQRMMSEEYGREFGGCLWLCIACMIAVAILGCIVLFT